MIEILGRPPTAPETEIVSRQIKAWRRSPPSTARVGRKITDDHILDTLDQVAAYVGHSPRVDEFQAGRAALQNDAAERGKLVLLASYASIHRRFPNWDDALAAAGLPPLGEKRTRAVTTRPGKQITETAEKCAAAINQARKVLGDPLSSRGYARWRAGEIKTNPTRAYELPSVGSIFRRFPRWNDAVHAAIAAS